MSMLLNIDKAVECVRTIFDNSRCVICDKTGGARMRYPCGHTACENCVIVSEDCSICLTTLPGSEGKPVYDIVLTKRVENATSMFKACQEAFNIDVYRRKRISEQLKLEKELFPECIQAVQKYGNKRKSLNTSYCNKENISAYFPGENISLQTKMENTVDYVHEWLNKSEKNLNRKPFRDLNSSDPRLQQKTVLWNPLKTKHNENRQNTSRKRPFKTENSVLKHQNVLDNFVGAATNAKNKKRKKYELLTKNTAIEEKVQELINDESGIVIDDDPIIIEDSQMHTDKDRDALLAILEADKNQRDSFLSLDSKKTEISGVERSNQDTKEFHVPFIKKGYLIESCPLYNNDVQEGKTDSNKSITQHKEVSITIDSESFTTVIKVCNVEQNSKKYIEKHSLSVQTEITESARLHIDKKSIIDDNELQQQRPTKENGTVHLAVMPSQDIFTDDRKKTRESDCRQNIITSDMLGSKMIDTTQGIIIADSDSDDDTDCGGLMEVTADIHRSCEEIDYGVLAAIDNFEEHEHRVRRPARGLTPDSSNSSEKENYNPNRQKKINDGKKYVCKKI